MKKLFLFTVLLAVAGNIAAQAIPMTKGCTWVYTVTVQYMKEEQEATKTFTSRMKIINTAQREDGYSAALITGNPQQYAFYEDSIKYNTLFALLRTPAGKYYLLDLAGKKFSRFMENDMTKLLKEETPFYAEGIKKDDVLCQTGEDSCEAKYHWSCADIFATSRTTKVFSMKNWDNTGTETWRITSNYGFENFSYQHNGTLATVKAVLKQFQK